MILPLALKHRECSAHPRSPIPTINGRMIPGLGGVFDVRAPYRHLYGGRYIQRIIPYLDGLNQLGATAIELMPVA